MGRTPIPRVVRVERGETPRELWHLIHDAAVDAGHEPAEAVMRADERYWPHDEPAPAEIAGDVSPFRGPTPGGLRPSTARPKPPPTPDTGRRELR